MGSLVSDVYDLATAFLIELGSFHQCKLATIEIMEDESAHGHGRQK